MDTGEKTNYELAEETIENGGSKMYAGHKAIAYAILAVVDQLKLDTHTIDDRLYEISVELYNIGNRLEK